MDKIVGRSKHFFCFISVILCLIMPGMLYAAQLCVYSHDGMPLKKAGVGQPFMIKYTVTYDDGRMQEPLLEGTNGLTVQRTGFQMSMVNGSSKATYTYLARAKKVGTYTVGPVRYVHDGKEHVSNTVTVLVASQQEIDTKQVNDQQKGDAFARLSVDKDRAYIGEKITYTIRFYYVDPTTEIEHLVRPQFSGVKVSDQKQGYAGKEKIKDTVYRYKEWSWDIYPTHVGQQIIEAHRLDFSQMRDTDGRMSRISLFFGPQVDHKRLYTNAVTVDVVPLPPHDGHIIGIGSFKQFKATIDPPVSKEGEAMVLSLVLEGEGNFEEVPFPEIQQLPDCFKSYASKQFIRNGATSDSTTKVFEFIVQGMKVGDWEIPSQECSYFDVTTGQYKTLCTSPLSVNVSSATYAQGPEKIHEQRKEVQEIEGSYVCQDELHSIATVWGSVHAERSLSWVWLIILSLLPLALLLGYILLNYAQKYRHILQGTPSRSALFKKARAEMCAAEKCKSVSKVYPLLVALIACLYKKPKATITQEYMHSIIPDNHAWYKYVDRAAEYAFYAPDTDTSVFFKEGLAWLDKLEKKR